MAKGNEHNSFAIAALALVTSLLMGCSSLGKAWKNLVSGKPEDSSANANQLAHSPNPKGKVGWRYSQYRDLPVEEGQKQFKRMTRDTFEDQARLEETAGSLWVMEGQGSYLFSQNVMRLSGDSLKVRLEGEPKKNLETKVEVLKKLIKKARKSERSLASADPNAEKKPDGTAESKPAEGTAAAAPGKSAAAKPGEKEKEEEKDDLDSGGFSVTTVPSRIVERLPDGSYRVRGSQSFMLGKNEYRVIVVGVARPKDISDEGVDSSALLDSKFDIVSVRKELKL